MNIDPKSLVVGQKVKFDNENMWYTVRNVRLPFIICTANAFSKGYYSILDVNNNIRGEGTSWGLGHKTEEQIEQSMLALHGENPEEIEQEISRRNRVPLRIVEIKELSKYEFLANHINIARNLGKEAADSVDDGGSANLDAILLTNLKGARERTLNDKGISCSKHWNMSGAFVLSLSFGQGNKNCAGLKAAIDYLKSQSIDCSMHYQTD